MIDDDGLLDRWRSVAARPVIGWDFSELQPHMTAEQPPWDYPALCRATLHNARAALDMGTGGGEFLLGLADSLPGDTVATEEWEANLPVATAALEPHGIPVVRYGVGPEPMPFPDGRFDVVLNRHEDYDPAEVARVLVPGGVFLTQQVGGDDASEIHDMFGVESPHPEVTLDGFVAQLGDQGFDVVDARAWHGPLSFADVATFVRYLTFVPWDLPSDFTVDRYRDVLFDVHESGPAAGVPITLTQSRFVIRARRT